MALSFKLDAAKAKEADKPTSTFIDTTGEYVGKFTMAKAITAASGTAGIEFTFQADDGAVARWLRLYVQKSDGTQVFGYGFLMALMTCLKVKDLDAEEMEVEEWINGGKTLVTVENYTPLCDKPIGVLLQREDRDGGKFQMNIVGFFEAGTHKSATEILTKATEAKSTAKKVAALKDKVAKDTAPAAKSAETKTGGAFDELDDDLPF